MGLTSAEPLIRRFFEWYGEVSYEKRWSLFLTPLILTPLLSIGWRHEFNVFSTIWPLNENRFLPGKSFETKRFVNILVKAKDGGDILRESVLEEIELLNQWIMYNITIPTADGKFHLSYQDLCLNYEWICGGNEHILMLRERVRVGHFIDITYPKGGNKDTPVYLGSTLGDVTLDETNGTLRAAKITQLFYFLKQEPEIIRQYSSEFSYAVEKFLLKRFESNIIVLSFAHYQSLQDGLEENAKHFKPNFIVSFTALSLYAIAFSFVFHRKPKKGVDWIRSKPYVACAGLLTTLLSLCSGFGAMLLFGVHYNVINTIIPFLIIAIGIDDMFIMNACWDRTDPSHTVAQRMSEMMAHAGVAVSITNITDILSFAIGCITELPGIEFFCSYACVTITFCYIYQLTFFTGFLALMGDAENNGRHCLFFYRLVTANKNCYDEKKAIESPSTVYLSERFSQLQNSPPTCEDSQLKMVHNISITTNSVKRKHPQNGLFPAITLKKNGVSELVVRTDGEQLRMIRRFFSRTYGPFIVKDEVRAFAILFYIIFLVFAVVGCVNFKEGLDPEKLVANNHYIAAYFKDLKKFWVEGPQLHVALLKPPNFADPVQRLWNAKLRTWLKYTGGSNQWATDIKFNETDDTIQAFRFQIALKNVAEPNDHKTATRLLRAIADQQPFGVQVYHEIFPFADQYLIIMPATIRNIFISLICMSVVALLLIPSLPSSAVILLSIISICLGVFGYMTFWDVNLDAVSMISIIMSIGFAVDLSAHITYAFVTSHGNSKSRVIAALETLGWPIFQGATSTITGITILYTVDAYIIQTFFKTIWLTMIIGLFHGLFFIPVALSFFPTPRLQNSVEDRTISS
uniref:SSD domain-containing protein n=1 Tax=Ascaris lumbricoides TaxID=6252 RepID=A0A0M3HPH2_ASCLU